MVRRLWASVLPFLLVRSKVELRCQGPWLAEPFCRLMWFPKSLWILRRHDGVFLPMDCNFPLHFFSCLLWWVFWCALFDRASLSLLRQPGSHTGGATTWCQTLCKPNWHSTVQACAAASGYGGSFVPGWALHPGPHHQRSCVVFREAWLTWQFPGKFFYAVERSHHVVFSGEVNWS